MVVTEKPRLKAGRVTPGTSLYIDEAAKTHTSSYHIGVVNYCSSATPGQPISTRYVSPDQTSRPSVHPRTPFALMHVNYPARTTTSTTGPTNRKNGSPWPQVNVQQLLGSRQRQILLVPPNPPPALPIEKMAPSAASHHKTRLTDSKQSQPSFVQSPAKDARYMPILRLTVWCTLSYTKW